MKKILVPGLILGVFIAYLAAKKRALQNLLLEVADIAINSQKTNIKQVVFNVKFAAENRENVPVTINQINLRLFSGQTTLADFNRVVNLTVGPNEVKQFTAEIKISNLAAVSTLLNFLASGEQPEFNVRGNVRTDLGVISINA